MVGLICQIAVQCVVLKFPMVKGSVPCAMEMWTMAEMDFTEIILSSNRESIKSRCGESIKIGKMKICDLCLDILFQRGYSSSWRY